MPSVASNVMMCVCAGTMGAMSVPAVQKVSKPRTFAKASQPAPAAAAPAAATAVECPPQVITVPLAGTNSLGAGAEPFLRDAGLGGGGLGGPPAGGPNFAPSPWPGVPQLSPPSAGAVPEPGTWLLMVSGFGMVGLALRGREPHKESA